MFVEFKNRYVEGAAAEVEYKNRFVVVLVETVGKCGSCRLVDYAQDFKPRDSAGVLSRLTLAVVEVSRNRDNRLRDGFAKVSFRVCLKLLQNHSGNFRRRVAFVVD